MSEVPEFRRMTLTPDNPGPPRTCTITDFELRGSLPLLKHHVFIIKCEPHFPKVITVARRFKQFLWLRNVLMKQFPCVFCPPLPGKQILKDVKFLEERKCDLERFLNRLQDIPMFQGNKAVLVFLTCPESTFDAKAKEIDKEMAVIPSDRLRQAFPMYVDAKLPTDLDFEIKRHQDEFEVQLDNLSGLLKQCFSMLGFHEQAKTKVEKLNVLLGELRTTEENLPRRDLEKRPETTLANWETFHDAMWQNFLTGFCRQVRYELQDAKAMIDTVNQLKTLRIQLESIRRTMEKWTTYQELNFEQTEQKKLDEQKETELTDLVDICAKIVTKSCDDGWAQKSQNYRSQIKNFTALMLGSWKDLSQKEELLYRES